MSTEFVETMVHVPVDRLGQFQEIFGRWLGGGPAPAEPTGWRDGRPWNVGDETDAESFYRGVSATARMVLDFWVLHPGEWLSGEQTAAAVGTNGPKGVAGTLSSVGKTAWKMKRQLPFEHRDGPTGASGFYRMTPTVAELFKVAKARVAG